jgi:pre-rRNA-processing protein TSR3
VNILILRDPRESKAKCSLTPLRGTEGVRFVDYHHEQRLDAGERVLLHPDGDELSEADRGFDLLLIDCSWRRVPKLLATVDGSLRVRRLPELVTAYPRRSKSFEDPSSGLASVEALYAASVILRCPRPELLAGYRWRDEFLQANLRLTRGSEPALGRLLDKKPTSVPPGT